MCLTAPHMSCFLLICNSPRQGHKFLPADDHANKASQQVASSPPILWKNNCGQQAAIGQPVTAQVSRNRVTQVVHPYCLALQEAASAPDVAHTHDRINGRPDIFLGFGRDLAGQKFVLGRTHSPRALTISRPSLLCWRLHILIRQCSLVCPSVELSS